MLLACLDTSTDTASFVLFEDGAEILSLSQECKKGASKLLPWIRDQIREKGIALKDINEWRVGKGPGSFTGMRVGIAFVKGVCYASGALFTGVNSGYGLLYGHSVQNPSEKKITVLHDGRREEVICNTFCLDGPQWVESGTEVNKIESLISLEQFKGRYITSMSTKAFSEDIRDHMVFIDNVNAGYFKNVKLIKTENTYEMDLSCEPIYVRPPVFINPNQK